MRKALRWLLALVVLIGTVSTAGAATAAEPKAVDIKDRLLSIPGMSLIEEKPYTGYASSSSTTPSRWTTGTRPRARSSSGSPCCTRT